MGWAASPAHCGCLQVSCMSLHPSQSLYDSDSYSPSPPPPPHTYIAACPQSGVSAVSTVCHEEEIEARWRPRCKTLPQIHSATQNSMLNLPDSHCIPAPLSSDLHQGPGPPHQAGPSVPEGTEQRKYTMAIVDPYPLAKSQSPSILPLNHIPLGKGLYIFLSLFYSVPLQYSLHIHLVDSCLRKFRNGINNLCKVCTI